MASVASSPSCTSVSSLPSSQVQTLHQANSPFTLEPYPGFIVKGDIANYGNYFKRLGGVWNPNMQAWIFDDSMYKPSVLELQRKASIGELPLQPLEIMPNVGASNNKSWKEESNGDRKGKKWSPEEHQDLLNFVKEGKSLEEVSQFHKRSETAIRARFNLVIEKRSQAGETVEQIADNYNCNPEYVREVIRAGARYAYKVDLPLRSQVADDNL